MENKKIIMLAGKGSSTNILYNALKSEFDISVILLEEPVNKITFLKNRIKKLGFGKVLGQVIFQLIIVKLLEITSTKRKKEILQHYQLIDSPLPEKKIIHVNSVNDNNCLSTLKNIAPGLIIVNGTRIISKKILDAVKATFINMHVGITPMYRGVHGGYWALVNNDIANLGVTIHIVDAGIDTGTILFQKDTPITKADNFVTYPLLQLAEGIPYMKMAITNFLNGTITPKKRTGETKLWYHPTIWEYFYYRFKKGIR